MIQLFSREDVLKWIRQELFDYVVDPDNVTESSKFVEDFALDDLDMIEICTGIEDEFQIDDQLDYEKCETIGQFIDLVMKYSVGP